MGGYGAHRRTPSARRPAGRAKPPGRADFFVSCAEADESWAEWIAWQLEAAGFRVLGPGGGLGPGTHWMTGVADGGRQ
jgi:hypothetical protein